LEEPSSVLEESLVEEEVVPWILSTYEVFVSTKVVTDVKVPGGVDNEAPGGTGTVVVISLTTTEVTMGRVVVVGTAVVSVAKCTVMVASQEACRLLGAG
jgi:hypothetical protein